MKKRLFLTSLVALFAVALFAATPNNQPVQTKNANFLQMDNAAIQAEMADLNALESHVVNNQGTTLESLQAENSSLVANADAVNGLGVEQALAKGDGMPTWAIVLIVVGGVLLLVLVLCCILGSLGSSVE